MELTLTAPGSQNCWDFGIGETKPTPGRGYSLKKEDIESKIKKGEIFKSSGGYLVRKRYLLDSEGPQIGTMWNDIFQVVGNEMLGYPTQKPEALLERIVKASSNVGDVVLDAFCGCGTTLAVAKRLNRKYVGVDISPTACRLVANRIDYLIGEIVGLPLTGEEIAALTGHEFQNAIINALDTSGRTIKVSGRGADGGIDGTIRGFLIQVKKFKAGRADLDGFVATMYRNKVKKALYLSLGYSSDFTKEVARLGRDDGIMVAALTFDQVVAGEHKKVLSDMENDF